MIDHKKRTTLKIVSTTAALTALPLSASVFARGAHNESAKTSVGDKSPEIVVFCDGDGCVSSLLLRNSSTEALQSIESSVVSVPGGTLDMNSLAEHNVLQVESGQNKRLMVKTDVLQTTIAANSAHGQMRFPLTDNVIVDHISMQGKASGKIYKLPLRLEKIIYS